jgi:hypothetical protein
MTGSVSEGLPILAYSWRWSAPSGTTDHTVMTLAELPNNEWRINKADSGPETEALYGSYDHAEWVDVPQSDTANFLTVLLHHVFDGCAPLNFDEFKASLENYGVEYKEGSANFDTWTGEEIKDG